jgi:hypothetical protein
MIKLGLRLAQAITQGDRLGGQMRSRAVGPRLGHGLGGYHGDGGYHSGGGYHGIGRYGHRYGHGGGYHGDGGA